MARQQSTEDRRAKALAAGALNRADSIAFLESWRARGGFEGELRRRNQSAELAPWAPPYIGPRPAVGHMPFKF